MQYSIGDKVMHTKIGAGQISGVEHRELVKGFEHYYVIKILSTGATVYVPMHKMEELGVRPVMSGAKLAQVLATLGGVPRQLSKDFKERQERIRQKLGTGGVIPIAEAVRDLSWRRQHANLTKRDEDLLNRGRELLATEMAVATDTPVTHAHEAIDAALETAMTHVADELEPSVTPAQATPTRTA